MSAYSQYLYGCLGKRSYHTRVEAEQARVETGVRAGELNSYRCPSCSKWHIGHSRPRNPRGTKGNQR
jgi:hypothetical protein